MKKMFFAIILSFFMTVPVSAADVNNFYFSDFTGDYYLTKDEEGVSHLRVIESVTAVFPDYEQNKGICRQIPYTNQNNRNLTLPSLTRENLILTRNGEPENIYSIEKESGYYNVCTGTDEYVLGEQTYVFEYEFSRVVTEFNEKDREYQELYWDTNGNGATQRFDKVTARLHFENMGEWTGDSWCYVGAYGESGRDRCTITKTDDGVMFEAKDLARHENLSFDVELKAKSFSIPEPPKSYVYVVLIVVISIICGLFICWGLWKYYKNREKANYYKSFFVKPEYQPHKNISLPEMAELYIGKKKDAKVAMLLEMVVKHKIELIKNDRKKWNIKINNLDGLGKEYIDLLSILNGGANPEVGEEIELKSRTATVKLINLKRSMEAKIVGDLRNDKLVEHKYKFGNSKGRGVMNAIAMSIVTIPIVVFAGIFILASLEDFLGLNETYAIDMVFGESFFIVAFWMIVVTVVIWNLLNEATQKYVKHTLRGLEASRYMDGLRLYIEMAEAERMKLLQSVQGVDVSPKGIVRLYEKLLPYAAVFGLEKSWMEEMKQYCEVEEIEEPDYLMRGITIAELSRAMQSASSYATTSTVMSSSGGGSSSGFSGGGGGGFSGGGGGGGGFSGR